MGLDTHINVILPHDITKSQKPARVLYFLHGLSGDCTKTARYTDIERQLQNTDLAVVFPEVQRSFYTDMRYGLKYFQYIAYELPELCQRMFNISKKREDTYVCGISMGGYGALKVGLSRPDFFSKIVAFSGVTNFKSDLDHPDGKYISNWKMENEFTAVCGDDIKLCDDEDTWVLSKKALDSGNPPKLLTICGTEDFLYQSNVEFKKHLDDIGYDAKFVVTDGYHAWSFWERHISTLLDFINN